MTAHVGVDTNSYGFAAVASEPIWMPGADDGDERQTYGWSISTGDHVSRLGLAFMVGRGWFSTLPAGCHVWVEEALILPKNIATTRKLVIMTGVLYAAFLQARPDAFWHWVDVASWRKAVLGKGSGRKEFLKELARQRTLVDFASSSRESIRIATFGQESHDAMLADYERIPDLYDAHCVMMYGRDMMLSNLVRGGL